MTKTEFNKLEPFNEEKFKKGNKVAVLYGGEVVLPEDQQYYEGHPEPIVLTVGEENFCYNATYAKNVIRMLDKNRYGIRLEYSEDIDAGVGWVVYDTRGEKAIANFLNAGIEAQEYAEEYAQFLNDVEEVINERNEASLWSSPFTITTTEIPIYTLKLSTIF